MRVGGGLQALDESAGRRIARNDYFPIISTFKHRLVRGEVQSTFFLLGIVTRETIGLEQRHRLRRPGFEQKAGENQPAEDDWFHFLHAH